MAEYNVNIQIVKREFRPFYVGVADVIKSFGLVNNGFKFSEEDCLSILYHGLNAGARHGWQTGTCWAKKLGGGELKNFPAEKFTNSVSAYLIDKSLGVFPAPLALVYKGSPFDALTEVKEGYFISKFVEGRRLYDLFEGLSFPKKEAILRGLGTALRHCAESGIYPLDFAPRDIVLTHFDNKTKFGLPIIVDTEHIEFGDPYNQKLIEKQKQQFREDYGLFVPHKKLERLESLVFS